MKYQTLAQLKAAYDSGELSKANEIWLDNDTSGVYVSESGDPDDYDDIKVFEMHPEEILWQALDLLGIPRDHV